ncbi:MAG TPA: cyanophycin synthetase, partial [Puia sp.]|nr:cyanophycin synthetase [Puia sp.]
GVKKGKGELYDYLKAHHGTAFVMVDYDYLKEMSSGIEHIISYGTREANLTGHVSKSEPFLSIELTHGSDIKIIHTQLTGDYNLTNVLAAVSVGNYFKVAAKKIKDSIENYAPSNSRSQLIERNSNKIILDAYNANPSSMSAAIRNLAAFHVNNKVLILGGMAELGAESLREHENIISLIEKYPWNQVVLVGGDFLKIKHPYLSFENALQARDWFQKQQFHDTYFLIKGSRSMQMEKVITSS